MRTQATPRHVLVMNQPLLAQPFIIECKGMLNGNNNRYKVDPAVFGHDLIDLFCTAAKSMRLISILFVVLAILAASSLVDAGKVCFAS